MPKFMYRQFRQFTGCGWLKRIRLDAGSSGGLAACVRHFNLPFHQEYRLDWFFIVYHNFSPPYYAYRPNLDYLALISLEAKKTGVV
jgi:hypothetical protein